MKKLFSHLREDNLVKETQYLRPDFNSGCNYQVNSIAGVLVLLRAAGHFTSRIRTEVTIIVPVKPKREYSYKNSFKYLAGHVYP
jgi:hypothetical protein